MLLTIVLAIVFWIVLSNHGRRIKTLEQKLSETKIPHSAAPQAPAPHAVPLHQAQPQAHIAKEMWPKAEPATSHEEDSGRLLGRMGIGAVFLAVAFFIKYAFDNNWVTEMGRIVVGILIGLILMGIGQYLRKKYLRFAEILTGGGIAILYLSIYAAHSFYDLTTAFTTAILLVVTTAIAFALGVANKDMTISVIAVIGGFITPFLVGSDTNNMIEIFAYLVLLNLLVLGFSFAKKWPQLSMVALAGTIINFIVWSMNYYEPVALTPAMIFLGLTFFIFFGVSLKRIASSDKVEDEEYVLMTGNTAFFAIASYLILYPGHQSMAALVSLLLGIVFAITTYSMNKMKSNDDMLSGFLAVVAVLFISLSILLKFTGITIAILWLVEALALAIIASSVKNTSLQSLAVGVYCLALFNFFGWNTGMGNTTGFTPVANKAFLVAVLSVAVAYIISYLYKTSSASPDTKKDGMIAFIVIANIMTLYAFSTQIIFYHQDKMAKVVAQQNMPLPQYTNQENYQRYIEMNQATNIQVSAIRNRSHTYVSILWAIYAAILTAIGFVGRVSYLRRIGLFLFVITAIKVVIDVWSLGQLYRIISFIVFGIIALVASFAYAKYKDRLKDAI